MGVMGKKEINANPAYKPHPFRSKYNLSFESGVMLDSQYFVGSIFGLNKEVFQFDALFYNSNTSGWNTGIVTNYIPFRWNTIYIPSIGADILYIKNETKVFNGQGPIEEANSTYTEEVVSTQFKMGLILKCRFGLFINPYLNIAYYNRLYHNDSKIDYNLKINLTYIIKNNKA